MQRKEHSQTHFYKSTITLIWKTDKDTTTKTTTKLQAYISLMNTDTKTLNKLLAIWIQQYFKRIIYHNQMVFIPGMQEFFNNCKSISVVPHINKLKNKNRLIISTDAEKNFLQNSVSFIIKTLLKVGTQGPYTKGHKPQIYS